ncbi:MAG: lipid-A-disaccharide synthase [Pseudolabrys sp.]
MTLIRPLNVFLVAGEESGDRLGGALMRALTAHTQGKVQYQGVGGDAMARAGLNSLFSLAETAIVGFATIPRQLPAIMRRIRDTAAAAIAAKPDVLVIIDSPEFTHRVAQRVRRHAAEIPIVDYVSPSVWAWRSGRAAAMRRYIDHVLALLPFEPAVYARLGGPPCTYVGHPLSERVDVLRPNADEQRRRDAAPPILLVMPGSRRNEIRHMLDVFARTVELVADRAGPLEIVMPTVPAVAPMLTEAMQSRRFPARVIVESAEKDAAFRSARAALVKSGTGTLELALAGVPMVASYRLRALEAFVFTHFVNTPSVVLTNLVLEEYVVPELLQKDATPERLAKALVPLIGDTPQREAQLKAFGRLDDILEIGDNVPSERAAKIVLDTAATGRKLPS